MRGLRCLLVSAVLTVALVGVGVPAGAEPAAPPLASPSAGEVWGPLVPVPIATRYRVVVWTVAISDSGHIAVAYTAVPRDNPPNDYPGYVLVRSPGGVWSAPHRLNPPDTVLSSVELGFDARGNLTAFWSSMTNTECCSDDAPPPKSTYTVASKPVHRRWTTHIRVGPVQLDDFRQDVVLSVAPSGKAAIGWRQHQASRDEFQFTVRVRTSADAPWGPARALSAVSNRRVTGDVAINDHGTAIAAWSASRPWPADTGTVQRSRRTHSAAWTAPVTIGRSAGIGARVEVASTPAGFTAITWVRPNRPGTVVDLGTPRGTWSRHVVAGSHGVAVGPHRTVVMVKNTTLSSGALGARAVTWRTNRTDWTTTQLAPRGSNAWVLAPAVDSTGRIHAPWTQWRDTIRHPERTFMSTHLNGWATTELWGWTRNSRLAAAAVSWNGRAVAIRLIDNLRGRTVAVQMRVLGPS